MAIFRKKDKAVEITPSISYLHCAAKTYTESNGQIILGRNVFNHCQIVGYIAKELILNIPEKIRDAVFPPGSELIAASHDIGKVSPTFFIKLHKAVNSSWQQQYPFLTQYAAIDEYDWGGHAGVSAVTLKAKIEEESLATIVGQHHGFTPNTGLRLSYAEAFGGHAWLKERYSLIEALKGEFNVPWPQSLSDAQIRAISGLTSVADWIGSGTFFEDPKQDWQKNIKAALNNAGYIPIQIKQEMSFEQIFGFPPREAQSKLVDICNKPGVYILEAPMGLGKTEAALYCAYNLLAQGDATGIYFALPTQLTSNKIHARFNTFLHAILEKESPHHQLLLLHGSAWLVETEMGEEGQPGRSWFSQSKRGLLAPFAVGTLDQALMAAMNVRYGCVRAFGLTGKVVILDEVHSYDAYTNVILDKLITLLQALQCTVIILSATLNKARKHALLGIDIKSDAYPLITAIANDKAHEITENAVTPPTSQQVKVKLTEDVECAIEEVLKRAEQGQQVLWIENSVNDAQHRYFDFAARCYEIGVACGLLHSRFTPMDRTDNENQWVNALGKEGWSQRAQCGRVIVGTQVLEQSLDIDADFLVTRFAPTDMLLQRFGRLWRHLHTPRPAQAQCEAWVLAPTLSAAIVEPIHAFGASAFVYSEYVLCRSLEAWRLHLELHESIALPNDIRPLIEQTYYDREETPEMAKLRYQLIEGTPRRKGLNALRHLATLTLSKAGKTQSDQKAKTRYSEEESAEILLLKGVILDSANKQTLLQLLNGEELSLPWQKYRLSHQAWRQMSAILQKQMVSCSQRSLPHCLTISRCQQLGLGNALYLGHPKFAENVPFAIALIDDNGKLNGFELNLSDKYHYFYRHDIGLKIDKKESQ